LAKAGDIEEFRVAEPAPLFNGDAPSRPDLGFLDQDGDSRWRVASRRKPLVRTDSPLEGDGFEPSVPVDKPWVLSEKEKVLSLLQMPVGRPSHSSAHGDVRFRAFCKRRAWLGSSVSLRAGPHPWRASFFTRLGRCSRRGTNGSNLSPSSPQAASHTNLLVTTDIGLRRFALGTVGGHGLHNQFVSLRTRAFAFDPRTSAANPQ